jgi:hypothetical protein
MYKILTITIFSFGFYFFSELTLLDVGQSFCDEYLLKIILDLAHKYQLIVGKKHNTS